MKRIKVPEFLKTAIRNSARFLDTGNQALCSEQVETVALAVCKALMEHPQVPTDEQMTDLRFDTIPETQSGMQNDSGKDWAKRMVVEWQRRCFVQEEPEIPEEIKDLLWVKEGLRDWAEKEQNEAILEAYRRGRNSR